MALEIALPDSMWITALLEYTSSSRSLIPDPAIKCLYRAQKLISMCSPPKRTAQWLPNGSFCTMVSAFHHSGWSNVQIGVTWQRLTCCVRYKLKCRIDTLSSGHITIGYISMMARKIQMTCRGVFPYTLVAQFQSRMALEIIVS